MFVFFCLIEKQFILNLNGNTLQHEFTHKSTVFFTHPVYCVSDIFQFLSRQLYRKDIAAVSCGGKIGAVWLGDFGVEFGLGLTGKLGFALLSLYGLCMVLLG